MTTHIMKQHAHYQFDLMAVLLYVYDNVIYTYICVCMHVVP